MAELFRHLGLFRHLPSFFAPKAFPARGAMAAAVHETGTVQKYTVNVIRAQTFEHVEEVLAPGAVHAAGVVGPVAPRIPPVNGALRPVFLFIFVGGADDVDIQIEDDA